MMGAKNQETAHHHVSANKYNVFFAGDHRWRMNMRFTLFLKDEVAAAREVTLAFDRLARNVRVGSNPAAPAFRKADA